MNEPEKIDPRELSPLALAFVVYGSGGSDPAGQ